MKTILLFVWMMLLQGVIYAQLTFKTEYFGRSKYHVSVDDTNRVMGRGAAVVYQGGVTIPLYLRMDVNNRPTRWALSVSGTYVKLNNSDFKAPLVIGEIMNMGVALSYLRPMNERWSVLTIVGGGLYMPSTEFSKVGFKHLLGSAGMVFIRHLRPNLVVGGGLNINNSFGYPMIFPAFYLNWETASRYAVKVEVIKGLEISVKYNTHERLSLGLVAEMNGQLALLEQDGQDKIFSHQYLQLGFRPELKLGRRVTVPVTVGMNATRPAKMMDRKLKSIFQEDGGYYFQVALFASVGVQIKL